MNADLIVPYLPYVTISAFILVLYAIRTYFLQIVAWIDFTPFRISVAGFLYIIVIWRSDALDLGTLYYIGIVFSSITLIYPVYVRDQVVSRDEHSNYSGMIFTAIVVQTVGLFLLPETHIVTFFGGPTDNILIYMKSAILLGLFGLYLQRNGLDDLKALPEGDEVDEEGDEVDEEGDY